MFFVRLKTKSFSDTPKSARISMWKEGHFQQGRWKRLSTVTQTEPSSYQKQALKQFWVIT